MPSSSARLAGKTAVITGVSGGQGRAAALIFAEQGARIIGCDLHDEGVRNTVEEIRGNGGEAFGQAVDLTDEDAVQSWADDTVAEHGPVHILYANAAATRFAPVGSTAGVTGSMRPVPRL